MKLLDLVNRAQSLPNQAWWGNKIARRRNRRPVSFARIGTTAIVAVLLYSLIFNSLVLTPALAESGAPLKIGKTSLRSERLPSLAQQSRETPVTIFERKLVRTGKQSRFTLNFDLPPGAGAPYILQVTNGEPDGTERVMDGIIRINGEIVVPSGILNPLQPTLSRRINSLRSSNTMEVEFFSLLQRSSLTVNILAGIRTSSTPPVISSFAPDRGIPGTLVAINGTRLIPSVISENSETVVTFTGPNNTRLNAQITLATPTQMSVKVPNGAITGPIKLTNDYGQATSAENFTVEPTDDFIVIVNPTTVNAIQRATGTAVVAVASVRNDFTQLATLSAVGLPANVTAVFDPPQITANTTSTLSLNLSRAELMPGSYPFTVRGTAIVDGHSVAHDAAATLNVFNAGKTTLTGRVLSTDKEPVMGATVSLDGQAAVTDAAGIFLLTGITAGVDRPVRVDGRTANAPGRRYPDIAEPATIIAGQANVVPFIFYLPAIDAQYEVPVIPNQITTAMNPRLPDLKMMIPANANLRNRDGTAVSTVSITPLPVDRTPAPLPSNVAAAIVYTSQPGGAITNIPIPVVYPNSTGLSPGTSNIPLYAFDHDTVTWYIYGRGRVSNDGRTIAPEIDPNTGQPYGLRDFSWHFPFASGDGNEGGDGCKGGGGCDSPCSANPVDLSTGAKHEEARDISFGGGRGELELTRIYTSDLAQTCDSCAFGRGFTHNYDIRLAGTFLTGGAGRLITPGNITGKLFGFVRTEGDGSLLFSNTINRSYIGDELRRRTNGTFEFRYKDGRVMLFNSSGRLTALRDANGNTTTLTYSGSNLTQVTDPVGRSLTFAYNGVRVTSVTDPLNRTWTYGYSGNQLIQVTDPLQHSTQYTYVIGGRLSSVIDARGATVKQIIYNSAGRVIRQTFADGGFETYGYALSGMEVTETTVTDALGRVTRERFNPLGYVIERTDEFGLVTKIQRDLQTNLILSTSGPCGCTEDSRNYDARGNVTRITDRAGNSTRYEYEPVFNKVSKITDRLNRITEFFYDSRGNLTSIKDPLNQISTLGYDTNGLLTSVADPLNHTVSLVYDANGNLIERHDALNNTSTMEYDVIGRLKAVVDPLLRRISLTYDDDDRITSLTDSANAATNFTYDNNDNLLTVTNALGKQWSYHYDIKNRRNSETDPNANIFRYTFDKADQLTRMRSPSGRQANYQYDVRGQQTAMVDGLGGRVAYEYDRDGNLVSLTDQRSNTTTFTYDQLYRLVGMRDPLANVVQIAYDAEGNVTSRTDRLLRQTAYTYDGLNRLTHIVYADAVVDYTYDVGNRLTRIDDSQSGALQWSYDDADRVTSAVMPAGTVGYSYNTASQVASMTAANRPAVNYGYDAAGRLSTLAQGSETFTYAYDTISRVTGLQRPNGVTTSYEYDSANRLSRLSHRNGLSQFIEDLQYTYNPDNEIQSIASLAGAPNLPLAKTAGPADAANRIRQFGNTSYQFDAEGQTTSQTAQQGTTGYTWDARGRLTQAALPGGQTVSYGYDALGRRISRSSGGASTAFLYDGDDVVLDNSSDGATVDYLNGQSIDDKLRQTSSTTGTNYFLQDHLGSTVALTNPSGGLTARLNYEPFGESTGSALTRYDYTGRERDSATGLLYYRARWMDAKQGRFISEDPIGPRGGLNLYAYVKNSPINRKDPLGTSSFFAKVGAFYRAVALTAGALASLYNNINHPPTLPPTQPEIHNPAEPDIPEPEVPDYPEDKNSRRKRRKCPDTEPAPKPEESPSPEDGRKSEFIRKMEIATGLTGSALIVYLAISEGSRIIPARNFVPIP